MQEPKDIYIRRKEKYSILSEIIHRTMNMVSLLRLVTAISIFIVFIFLSRDMRDGVIWGVTGVLSAIFIYLIIFHNKLKHMYKYFLIFKDINSKSIDRLEGKWVSLKDTGEEFINEEHNYTFDLDIFGQGSLFQYINNTCTSQGRNRLAYVLSNPFTTKKEIDERQDAIKELSKKRWWRQRLLAEGMTIEEKNRDSKSLIEWGKSKNTLYSNKWFKSIVRILPFITILSILAGYILGVITWIIPTLLIITQYSMGYFNRKNINKEFNEVYKYKDEIKVYWKILNNFEKAKFKSSYLIKLKNRIKNDKGYSAIKQFKVLDKIVENILNRKNILFIPINVLTLWDYHCLIALYKWKNNSGDLVRDWLYVVGEIEVLSSLSSIGYDNPQWSIPEIAEEDSVFISREIAHPLLINKSVSNSIKIQDPSRIVLITGSNMAGKSTFLRTIGINLVLAYSGTYICGERLRCSLMNLQTCMRISDDLEAGISSFYGELRRISNIVKASKEDTQVFFLLDEIFKGTNSYDRHLGAKMLLKQMYKNNAMGLVSTHDLELGELEKSTMGNVLNYHFQEHYKEGQIHFDYLLRRGVSTTRNAIYLMKMAGVDIEN
ncbi:DNA mismatch repair protein [Clostridium sp. D2Q-11]|uniref:DNA mismatch repair protein n=1 Tax=Anaeromonas frigoriresistens TaxID=2683708 RepID=A0A942USV7_9FIRM|nr:DNA mismatch repair protein [Anaeromonas frigoriresistens]MBS4538604.1 DNA mismatch repair protein [Anaeromonas frigoriresistens]